METCWLAEQRTRKPLNLRTTHRALPALGLHVDIIEAKSILLDDPVDPLITSATYDHAGIGERSAVAEPDENVDDEPFETRRCDGFHTLQQLATECFAQSLVADADLLIGCQLEDRCRRVGGRRTVSGPAGLSEGLKLSGKRLPHFVRGTRRLLPKHTKRGEHERLKVGNWHCVVGERY